MTDRLEKFVRIALCLVERDGKLLMLERRDPEGAWDKKWELPGGKIEVGEEPAQTAVREILEETGLDVCNLSHVLTHNHTWDLPERIVHVHIDLFRGQAESGEVVTESDKAYGHAWFTPQQALAMDLLEANFDMLSRVFGIV